MSQGLGISLFLFYLCCTRVITDVSNPSPYCSFFSNRAPSPQPALTNCTWYKENSCCRDNEVRLIFSQVNQIEKQNTLILSFEIRCDP